MNPVGAKYQRTGIISFVMKINNMFSLIDSPPNPRKGNYSVLKVGMFIHDDSLFGGWGGRQTP